MKITSIGTAATAALAVVLGLSFPCHAAQERPTEKQDHGKPQQNAHQQSRPARQAHPQRQEQAQQQRGNSHPERTQPQARPQAGPAQRQHSRDAQQHPQQARNGGRLSQGQQHQLSQQNAWQQHRASDWQSQHRDWNQRGGYHGYHIPDDRFRGYFGEQHGFRIGGLPFMVYGGYPRFQYGGYWFSMVDPYPADWSNNWYATDEVYVAYANNGYYLYNRRHPGIGIAISISR